MPVIKAWNDEGELCDRYLWGAQYIRPTERLADLIRMWRRDAGRDREDMERLQKEYRDTAKFFKAEARHYLRLERACTLAMPWFGVPDKKQVAIRPLLWPIDLASEMDEIAGRIYMAA